MHAIIRKASLVGGLVLGLTASASAQAESREPGYMFNLNVGQIGIDRSLDSRWRYGAELRFKPMYRYKLVPSVGFAVSDFGANFIYADVKKEFFLNPHWYLTPSFGAGLFNETDEFRLGQSLEFRSGLEGGYRFNNGYRLGVAIFHLSNGGLADENPGTEALVLSLTMPL